MPPATSPATEAPPRTTAATATMRWAFAAALIGVGWQIFIVAVLYKGDPTALFHHGENIPLAPEFAGSYRFPVAYDGAIYRYIAHHPAPGESAFVDFPTMRYRRILIPMAAWVLGAGRTGVIDYTYMLVILLFVGLGAYWLGRCLKRPWCALLFLLVPGVLSGLERMTIDVAIIALTVGMIYCERALISWRWMAAIACVAPLVRETGFLLAFGVIAADLLRRRWRRAMVAASAATPALMWFAFVATRTGSGEASFNSVPFGDLWLFMNPAFHTLAGSGAALAAMYYVGIIGIFAAIVVLPRRTAFQTASGIAAWGFAGIAVAVSAPGMWLDVYHFGRVFAPLLLLVAAVVPWRLGLAPIALVSPGLFAVSANTTLKAILALVVRCL